MLCCLCVRAATVVHETPILCQFNSSLRFRLWGLMLFSVHKRHDFSVRLALDLPDPGHHMLRCQWNRRLLHPGSQQGCGIHTRTVQSEALQESALHTIPGLALLLPDGLHGSCLLHRRLLPIRWAIRLRSVFSGGTFQQYVSSRALISLKCNRTDTTDQWPKGSADQSSGCRVIALVA